MKKWGFLSLFYLLSACMVGPDYHAPQVNIPEKWENATLNNKKKPKDIWEEIKWWENYKDPLLNQLIRDALKSNYNLKAALANINQARASLVGAEAAIAPEIDGMGSYNHNENSLNAEDISGLQGLNNAVAPPLGNGSSDRFFDLYWLGFNATWEIDLFGRLRRGIEAAEATLEMQVEDMHAVLLSLISDVALNYINLRSFQQQHELTQKSFQQWDSIYKFNKHLLRAGLATEIEVAEAKAARDQTKASLSPIEAIIKNTMHQLSILTGNPPAFLYNLLCEVKPIPQIPAEIFVGLPSELLKRRPDIRAAERNLAASTAQIGIEEGSLFPIFTFTGLIGYQSNLGSNLFSPASGSYSFGPGVTWSLIDFGRVRARINSAKAGRDANLYEYKNTLLKALADVENSLVNYTMEMTRYNELNRATEASKQAAEVSLLRYEAGLSDYLIVLQSEITYLGYALNLLQSQTTLALNSVALYKALGGGWEIERACCLRPAPNTVSQRED